MERNICLRERVFVFFVFPAKSDATNIHWNVLIHVQYQTPAVIRTTFENFQTVALRSKEKIDRVFEFYFNFMLVKRASSC